MGTKLSANTLKRARNVAESTMVTACSIYSPSGSDDGYGTAKTYGLREVSTCDVHVLGNEFLTDEMRARNAQHFAIQIPADSNLAIGERLTTTWTPDGESPVALTIEITDVNTPRQGQQLGIEAIGYQI